MKTELLKQAVWEAQRFLLAAGEVQKNMDPENKWTPAGSANAAVRRASMDLTKSLSKLRNTPDFP